MRRVCWGKERRRILPGISPGGKNLAAPLRQSGRKKVRVFHRAGREHPDQIFINGSMLFMANDSAGLSQLRTSTELKTHRLLIILCLTFYDLCRLIRTLYREGPAIFPVQKHGLIAACFAGLRRGWLCRLFIIRTQNNVALIHKPAIFTDHIGVITDGIATGRLARSGITIRQGRRFTLTGENLLPNAIRKNHAHPGNG